MTTDDLWRVALVAAGNGVLILFFQALRKPPPKTDGDTSPRPVWGQKTWDAIFRRRP